MNSAYPGCQNYLDLSQCYLPQPSEDNIDLCLNNSGYPAQPHPIIVNNCTAVQLLINDLVIDKTRIVKRIVRIVDE